ncbi:MAG: response regulator transcription factor [Candidatus Acidiferrum sp.]|jgi:DNA-binding NarL/FixJ family response regulator
MRILVVDDHETVRKGVSAILSSREDIEVCGEAANGEEAIRIAKELKPDLVILDVNMPVLGGFAAAQELKRLMPELPILFFTMNESAQFVIEAKKLGVQGFVSKDRAGAVLLAAVDALLRKETYFVGLGTVT